MAYKELSDVRTVVLGGIDKNTGKKNPSEVEGYFLRIEKRPNRFNVKVPQNYYVFQTEEGEVGVYGKAGVDREMKKCTAGRMTKLSNTGKILDTGKGNPMQVFKVAQDPENTIEIDSTPTPVRTVESSEDSESYGSTVSLDDESADETLFDDESAEDEIEVARPKAPARPAAITNSSASKVQSLLAKRRIQ